MLQRDGGDEGAADDDDGDDGPDEVQRDGDDDACRGFVNRSAIEVGVWRFVEGVNMAERSGMVVARVCPASDPAMVARPYVLL
jgi:hypothetical protein